MLDLKNNVSMVVVGIFLLTSIGGAETVFSEDWNTGNISPSVWTITDSDGTDIVLENLGRRNGSVVRKGDGGQTVMPGNRSFPAVG